MQILKKSAFVVSMTGGESETVVIFAERAVSVLQFSLYPGFLTQGWARLNTVLGRHEL